MATRMSNPDQDNYFRMTVLIVDYALKVLQDVLQKELTTKYPSLFDPSTGLLRRVLGDGTVRATLFGLSPSVFNYDQQNLLYPGGNPFPLGTVDDLDITLTVLLLRNITTLNPRPPLKAWDNPSDTDTSREATIGRVKRYRNIVYGHANKAAISDQDFRAHFSGLKSILLSLSSAYTDEEYDAILFKPLDTALLERNQSILKDWYNYDKDVKDYFMSMQATLEENHEQITHGLKESETKLQDHVEQVHKRSEDTILKKMDSDSRNTQKQLEEISQGITQMDIGQSEMADQLRQSHKCMEEVKDAQKQDSQNILAQLEKGAEELATLRSTLEMQENVQTICDRDRDTPEFQKIPVGANAPDASSIYTKKFARLCYLVTELGTKVIRTFFLKDVVRPSITNGEHISDKDAVLQFFGKHDVKSELEKLKKTKVIYASQWNLLYPASGHTDVKTFDITLLVLLIRNPYPDKANLNWSALKENATLPSSPQTTQGFIDHIQRLKNVRNYIQHSATFDIEDTEKFWTIWEIACASVLALGADPNEVKKIQEYNFSEQEIYIIVYEICSSEEDNKRHFDSRFDRLELLIFSSVCAVLFAILIALAINNQWWI